MRILVIEDNQAAAKLARVVLAEQGYAVDVAHSGEEGRVLALVNDYDGVLLDLELGDRNGVEVLQAMRRAGKTTPVLVLTGRDASESIVSALDAGADEYVVKPIGNDELISRVRALVRRGDSSRAVEQLSVGGLVLNRLTRRVRTSGGEVVLTPKELALLEHLMMRAGEVVTRTELLEKVWDMHSDPDSNVVDVHVARLRRKLEGARATVSITARRGFGFVLAGV